MTSSASSWRLRCIGPRGSFVVSGLTGESSVNDLLADIASASGIAQRRVRLLTRFPPMPRPTPINIPDNRKTLASVGIRSGDLLHIEESDESAEELLSAVPGILMKHVVPADNSCLFNAVAYALSGSSAQILNATYMRQIVASTVSSNPSTYISAMLDDRTNNEYSSWILLETSWGGAVELSIFARHFEVEIVVVNAQNASLARFGEDSNYQQRIFLLYDGIHYDPLVLISPTGGETLQSLFSTSSDSVLVSALELAQEAQRGRQFTDLKRLPMSCLVCKQQLAGPVEAQKHAQEKGHINFKEET
uniref:Ubiquitin thioesterase OTU n=1 Tax=Strigamia maritima TaxID=126957 RepID=T1JAT8_STRMM